MPYVDIYSKDDYASIFYTTNSLYGNVGGFDSEKPTVIMLHPMFLASHWLSEQFSDSRLDSNFNLIAFDMRTCGKSSCRSSGKHDSWVEAADIALCMQSLALPPCHILAFENVSVNCAERLAILFPELCLSLTLCNVPAPSELKWLFTAFDELIQSFCYAEDLEAFEHTAMEATRFIVGPDCDPDLRDDIIEDWEVNMPPYRRTRCLETMAVIMNRTPLNASMLKEITQPVLIIHGERNEVPPLKYAERLAGDLVNVEGGAVLYVVKGGAGALNIVPGTASITNQVISKFISRLPSHRSDLTPYSSKEERMATALNKLAQLTGDPTMSARDPMSPLSFSCLAPEVVKGQTESLELYKKGEASAFDPCGPDGKPIRRFSDTRKQHWFQGEKDGISYASPSFKNGKQDVEYERSLPIPHSEPISGDVAQGRLRRATISPSSVDKHVIKGSMAKVVNSNSGNSFSRLIK